MLIGSREPGFECANAGALQLGMRGCSSAVVLPPPGSPIGLDEGFDASMKEALAKVAGQSRETVAQRSPIEGALTKHGKEMGAREMGLLSPITKINRV